MLTSMSGHDEKDTTSADIAVPDFEKAIGKSVKGMKIGIPREYRVDGMSPEIEALWHQGAEWLRAAGAEIVDVSLPHTRYALPAYYIVAPAEAGAASGLLSDGWARLPAAPACAGVTGLSIGTNHCGVQR